MSERREQTTVVVLTALALVCRLVALGQPMRFDESVSWAYYVGRSWETIVGTYQQPNNHVFYSLLAKLTGAPANYAPWALRLPALIAGVAITPLTWSVGKRFADSRSALIAAALSVGSTQLILYSANARGYSLVVALFLVLLLIADRLVAAPSMNMWAAFAACAAIGLYTIPVMLYPLGVVAVWLAMSAGPPRTQGSANRLITLAAALACALAIAGLLYLPIINHDGLDALFGNRWVTPSRWPVFVKELPRMFAVTLSTWSSPLPAWSAPVAGVMAIVGLPRLEANKRARLSVAAAIWCTLLLCATHRVPFIRVWLFLLPLFLLSVSRGVVRVLDLSRAPGKATPVVLATGLAVAMCVVALLTRSAERTDDTGAFRSARSVAALLAPRVKHGDRILAPIPAIGPLLYYTSRVGTDTTLLTVPVETAARVFIVLDTDVGQTLAWAVKEGFIDPAMFSEPTLLARYPDGEVWETVRRP